MRKGSVIIIALLLLAFSCFAPKSQIAYAADISDNPTIILSEESHKGTEIRVRVKLTQNTGIYDMLLELVYDADAMTLVNVEKGNALSSLSFLMTNPDTELGYGITPFRFLYSSDTHGENDFSTGILFELTFELKENVKNGNYNISLKYERDKSVTYYTDEGVKTKNLFIDGLDINICDNSITQIAAGDENNDLSTTEEKSISLDIWIIVVICVVAVMIIGAVCVLVITKKRNNRKKK